MALHPLLREAIEQYPGHRYRLAYLAGVSPSVLSGWMHDRYLPVRGDRRVLKLARLVGLGPEQCFALKTSEQTSASGGAA